LRREEVAVLADVGITWYTWLEQGRPIRVAPETLDRIADALRLDRHERSYLHVLASTNPPAPTAWSAPPPRELVRVVQAYTAGPAYMLNARWDVLAWNAIFERVFRFPGAGGDRNSLRNTFLRDDAASIFMDWDAHARRIVASFRVSYAAHVGDAAFEELIAELRARSALFASLWLETEVRIPTVPRSIRLRDASAQTIYRGSVLLVPDQPETTVVFCLVDET
jgi:transcriptional regulator with XRE-family HTH domain